MQIVSHCLLTKFTGSLQASTIVKVFLSLWGRTSPSCVKSAFGNAVVGGWDGVPGSSRAWAVVFTDSTVSILAPEPGLQNHSENTLASPIHHRLSGPRELPKRGCSAGCGWLLITKNFPGLLRQFAPIKIYKGLLQLWQG